LLQYLQIFIMSGSGSNIVDISTPRLPRSKNSAGNRIDIGWKYETDVLGNGKKVKCNYCSKINNGGIFRFKHHLAGTRYDSESCLSVPEEIKALMMKVVFDAKDVSTKKRRLTNLEEIDADDESGQRFSSSKNIFINKSTGEGVQATLNQLYKKGDEEKVDAQVVEFFYTSAFRSM